MKRLLSCMTALFLCLSLCTALVSCNETEEPHEHSFRSEWTYDKTSHWHECIGESCPKQKDKAEHTWVDRGVISDATPESDGVAQKECSVCKATENASVTFAGISKSKWDTMLSAANFENYTLTTEGVMTVTSATNSFPASTSRVKTICNMTADKMALQLFAADENAQITDSNAEIMVYDGEIAKAQKVQYAQLFLTVLEGYEHFVYDAETQTYKITETITIQKNLESVVVGGDDSVSTMEVPAVIVIKNAEATLSADGKILKLVCDYSQAMEMNNDTVTTSGLTTWIFTDYGTTVIEATKS
ncbi:MAG: hypothetical protein IJY42_04800 [Clostridia bacterium]|nr:hypothetical protein [Clostridia bacterium]